MTATTEQKRRIRTQRDRAVADPGLGSGLFAAGLAQTLPPAVTVATRRGVLNSFWLHTIRRLDGRLQNGGEVASAVVKACQGLLKLMESLRRRWRDCAWVDAVRKGAGRGANDQETNSSWPCCRLCAEATPKGWGEKPPDYASSCGDSGESI